jgi:hypothetical protein
VIQIMLLDIVFSLDSVITAVGMVSYVPVMVVAMVIAVAVMLVGAGAGGASAAPLAREVLAAAPVPVEPFDGFDADDLDGSIDRLVEFNRRSAKTHSGIYRDLMVRRRKTEKAILADIDGPLLLAEDPYPGVSYDRGRVTLPPGPGLGVKEDDG